MSTAIIIGCGAAKLTEPAPARDLYTGSLFRAARAAAESTGLPWFILSALHGLIHPDTVIGPYDVTLRDGNDFDRAVAATKSTRGLLPTPRVGIANGAVTVDVCAAWCSSRYVEVLASAHIPVDSVPLRGLTLGRQIQWFRATAATLPVVVVP